MKVTMPSSDVRQLDAADAIELKRWEAVIERGVGFDEVGTAFQRIRDGRLYCASHETFEGYCLERWKLSKRDVNRQIKAAVVADNLRSIGVKATHEAQLRPLAPLSRKDQRTVWTKAVEQSGGQQPDPWLVGHLTTDAYVERQEQTVRRRRNRRRTAGVWMSEVVNAIEVLSDPSLDMQDIAFDLACNEPDEDWDWPRQVDDAQAHMNLLVEELLEVADLNARVSEARLQRATT